MNGTQQWHLREIAKECYVNATEHGFHSEHNPLPQSLMLIVSECAEALEAYRDDVLDDYKPKSCAAEVDKPIGVASELADVVIRALDSLVEYFGPERAASVIAEKMAYNVTRPVGHGRVRH